MKFAFSALSSLLLAAPAAATMVSLRGSTEDQERNLRIARTGYFNETLNECTGAVCAVYGDPHIITCDGLSFDCQAEGVFTLMENDLFTIQGHLEGMKEEHRLGWLRRIGGSLLQDVVIKNKDNPDLPILQLGFGDVQERMGEFPSHVGCAKNVYWYPRKKYRSVCSADPSEETIDSDCTYNHERHGIEDVYMCRDLCESMEGCAKFNYWYDNKCELYPENDASGLGIATVPRPGSWNMVLAGSMNEDECGVRKLFPESKVEQERLFHGAIGKKGCPLLMHLDGELQDISFFAGQSKGYLLGDKDSDLSVRMHNTGLHIKYRTSKSTADADDWATFKLGQSGAGPGEKWNCHWHMFVCLPQSFEDELDANPGVGLLGSVNGDKADDWMTPDGDVLEFAGVKKHQEAYDYCDDNWCVEQADSMMAFPGDWTWESVKCSHKNFTDVDINDPECVLSADYIIQACAHVPAMLRYGCELDCCYGGCDQGNHTIIDEILDLKKLVDEPEGSEDSSDSSSSSSSGSSSDSSSSSSEDEGPDHDQCHPGRDFLNTGDTVCPGAASGSVVKILQSSGSDGSGSLPGANDILYGLALDIEPNERVDGKNLRFLVNNPFGSNADIYVQHDRNVLADKMLEPACVPQIDTETGCDKQAVPIEVACRDYHNGPSFALIHVYFSSPAFPATEGVAVDKCCLPEEESSSSSDSGENGQAGVIAYTFSIQCGCPDESTA